MWNENTMSALQTWLSPETWYKHHPIDDGRFYNFIVAVWDERRSLWDESLAREIMNREAKSLHPDVDPEFIAKTLDRRRSEGTLILDFLTHVKEGGTTLQT